MLESFVSQLVKLIDVKTIVTFLLIALLVGLAWRQNVTISAEVLTSIISAVITYFFTKQKEQTKKE